MSEQYPISSPDPRPDPDVRTPQAEPELWAPAPAAATPTTKFHDRKWLHLLLLVLTIASTTFVGIDHYLGFISDYGGQPPTVPWPSLLVHGLWYSGTILLILGAHELGHYLACRYYQVDASLPFFLPMPLVLTGTLGAFIRIREPIPTKRMLFDIGAAGPFAGMLFAVPALFIGVALSHVAKVPQTFVGAELGEPLLFKLASWGSWGHIPDGYSLNLHPVAFAAWFGLLATALNLFPIGQLDGGHISYAVLGRRSSRVTIGAIVIAIGLAVRSTSWVVWTVMMLVMTITMGPHHPPTRDEHIPLNRARLWLAALAALMLILCFTPSPISLTP